MVIYMHATLNYVVAKKGQDWISDQLKLLPEAKETKHTKYLKFK